MRGESRRTAALASVLLFVLLVAGCTTPSAPPVSPSASGTAITPPPPFTVTTTEVPTSYDPAGAQTGADAIVALNVFQRLLIVHSGSPEPKPDAGDCLFKQPTVYECTLLKGLVFSNGHALTASDVKFSIERAYRLNIAGTSIKLFDSLQRVEVVDDLTVRFYLSWADNQFGVALATPAASIVDEDSYDPDKARPNSVKPIGSGPFALDNVAEDSLTFIRNYTYQGATRAGIDTIRLAFAADSATVEQVMAAGTTQVVWRSLDSAALGRLASGTTRTTMTEIAMPDARVQRLLWNPASELRGRAEVRAAVAAALEPDRTLTSLVPPTVAGSTASFPAGGRPTATPVPGSRLNLTLAYSSRAPGQADLARLLRDRLEGNAGMSVQLKPDASDADLVLTDAGAWANTALGWLQAYTDAPLPGSAAKLAGLTQTARTLADTAARQAVLAEIQQQAAADATVLPVSLTGETLFVGADVKVVGDTFGPCWQLGLWGFTR